LVSIDVFIAFGLGIAAGVIVRLTVEYYYRPVIAIEDVVITRRIDLNHEDRRHIPYIANRIRVINTGKTAAKDCKVYVDYEDERIERTAWMLPDNNSAHTITLNVRDREFVDLCAISDDETLTRIVSLEHGYSKGTVESCTILPIRDPLELTVRVTSSNTQPNERRISLYNTNNHFHNQLGRIVEFISQQT
jgi:hypothetical protein